LPRRAYVVAGWRKERAAGHPAIKRERQVRTVELRFFVGESLDELQRVSRRRSLEVNRRGFLAAVADPTATGRNRLDNAHLPRRLISRQVVAAEQVFRPGRVVEAVLVNRKSNRVVGVE
ncbi:MAG: hypothetical protein ACK55I_19250, partial [bacterium]